MKYRFIRFPQGKAKALTASYDDGGDGDRHLIEVADRYGIRVTLNLNSHSVDDEKAKAIAQMIARGGHEIATHGARHIAPGNASLVDGIHDTLECRQRLERQFGGIIRGMAYPDSGIRRLTSGVTKEEIKSYLQALGIVYARSLGEDNDLFELPRDFWEWMPTAHHTNPLLMPYLDKFLNEGIAEYAGSRAPKLFYVWGHSFEFERDGNWSLWEEFCQKAGNRSDVWYATNIEIADYVRAYRSLRFNVDNTLVYNPTCTEVWLEADKKLLSVKPDEWKTL